MVCEKLGAVGMKFVGQLHVLFAHEAAGEQASPQAPQFFASDTVSTHWSPHLSSMHAEAGAGPGPAPELGALLHPTRIPAMTAATATSLFVARRAASLGAGVNW
jgi:hypothetical protein